MRRLCSTGLLLVLAGAASAHGLSEEAGAMTRFSHQLLGSHHLPVVVLLLLAGIVAIRALAGSKMVQQRSSRDR